MGSDPISPNYRGGGPAIYYEHLAALSELGHDLHLWHYAYPDTRKNFNQFVASDRTTWAEVEKRCGSMHFTTFSERQSMCDRMQNRIRGLLLQKTPLPRTRCSAEIKQLIERHRPDFIWAQHFEPTLIAITQREVPVVYSHHDWLYRIKALRFGRLQDERMRRLEEKVARRVHSVVSGSATECAELRQLGCRQVHYIPVSYEMAPWNDRAEAAKGSSIVHLGGMGTTATRVGMERFFEVVWPEFGLRKPKLVVVGDTSTAPAKLKELLKAANCTGFVPDLSTVLRPFDLHIIPWEHSTGQRTRLPVAFNYGQVVVAVRGSVACFPEAKDGENCRLLDRLDQMAAALRELLVNPAERERLGRAARKTFETNFTRTALLPRYMQALASLN